MSAAPWRTEHTTVSTYTPLPDGERENQLPDERNIPLCSPMPLTPTLSPAKRGRKPAPGKRNIPPGPPMPLTPTLSSSPGRKETTCATEETTLSAARLRFPQAQRLSPSQSECFYKPECRSGYHGCPAAPVRSLPGSKRQQSREPYQ